MILTHLGEIVGAEDMTPGMVLDSLRGVDCQACGGLKRNWAAFCKGCYKRLPDVRRNDLVRSMQQGFADAFVAALKFLTTKMHESHEIEN
jgi:hypothetical protein